VARCDCLAQVKQDTSSYDAQQIRRTASAEGYRTRTSTAFRILQCLILRNISPLPHPFDFGDRIVRLGEGTANREEGLWA
jgi:hypothetical protein